MLPVFANAYEEREWGWEKELPRKESLHTSGGIFKKMYTYTNHVLDLPV